MVRFRRILLAACCLTVLLCISADGQRFFFSDKEDRLPPEELRGKNYVPDDVKFDLETRGGEFPLLANWDVVGTEDKLKKVRFYGFVMYNDNKPIDWETDDPVIVSTIARVFEQGFGLLRRKPQSDVGHSFGAAGRGAHRGVIALEYENERTLILGVSHHCFFLGIYHGNNLQAFESWILAKQLDDVIFELTGKHLEDECFQRLSGEHFMNRQKTAYSEIRKAVD